MGSLLRFLFDEQKWLSAQQERQRKAAARRHELQALELNRKLRALAKFKEQELASVEQALLKDRQICSGADDFGSDLDQLLPQRGQQPVPHCPWQDQRAHEVAEIVSKSVKLKPPTSECGNTKNIEAERFLDGAVQPGATLAASSANLAVALATASAILAAVLA